MKVLQLDSELYCSECHAETTHRVTYLNTMIQKIECLGCHQHIGSDIEFKKELYAEMVNRVSSKPFRVVKELNENTFTTIRKLPFRMFQKPFNIINDVRKSHNEYKQTKDC